ncbi:MAG: hypothetical protein M1383_00185 [Patescibacteria group bacterium]|nr:hypothetical protein [Patescibacteria group bacterium]
MSIIIIALWLLLNNSAIVIGGMLVFSLLKFSKLEEQIRQKEEREEAKRYN